MTRASYVLLALGGLRMADNFWIKLKMGMYRGRMILKRPNSTERPGLLCGRAGVYWPMLTRATTKTMRSAEPTKHEDETNPYLAGLRGVLSDIGLI